MQTVIHRRAGFYLRDVFELVNLMLHGRLVKVKAKDRIDLSLQLRLHIGMLGTE
jgi:hypothetical protein